MGMSQILMIILLGTNLLFGAHLHGKPKTGDHDFFVKGKRLKPLVQRAIFIVVSVGFEPTTLSM